MYNDPWGTRLMCCVCVDDGGGSGITASTKQFEYSKGTAVAASLRKEKHDQNHRPYKGEPGSTFTAPNGDTRTYGPDGKPQHDYDHDDHGAPSKHPHDSNGGHHHDWTGGKRGAPYAADLKPVAGVALVTICVIGIVIVAADDATGIGIADDFLFCPLGAGIGEGFLLIAG